MADLLFEPIEIGGRTFRNRIVCAPHYTAFNPDGRFSDRYRVYLTARAEGGAGWIVTEPAQVHPSGRREAVTEFVPWNSAVVPNWHETVEGIHAAGSRVSLTIGHSGRNTSWLDTAAPTLSASDQAAVISREIPAAVDRATIEELTEHYAVVAQNARAAGFDGVELQATADYFIGTFLSPLTNDRDDEYGGSLENRGRLLAEFLAAIRAAVGTDLLLGLRISADHGVRGGLKPAEAASLLGVWRGQGLLDYASVIVGSYFNLPLITPTMDAPQLPAAHAGMTVRNAGVTTVLAGRIPTPAIASEVLEGDAADLIAFARPFIADPAWPEKARNASRGTIRSCLYCNQQCVTRLSQKKPISCVQNPAAGREHRVLPPTPDLRGRSALIVGAGPGGLEAAIQLHARGAEVTIVDRADEPGGRVRLASQLDGRGELFASVAPRVRDLEAADIRFELGRELDLATLAEAPVDEVVVAVGATNWVGEGYRDPTKPTWSHPPQHVVTLDAAATADFADQHVLVVDEEGSASVIAVLRRARRVAASVTIVTSQPYLGYNKLTLSQEFTSKVPDLVGHDNVVVYPFSVADFTSAGAFVRHLLDGHERSLTNVDVVVNLQGDVAPRLPAAIRARASIVGDAAAPRGIGAALLDGWRLGQRAAATVGGMA